MFRNIDYIYKNRNKNICYNKKVRIWTEKLYINKFNNYINSNLDDNEMLAYYINI